METFPVTFLLWGLTPLVWSTDAEDDSFFGISSPTFSGPRGRNVSSPPPRSLPTPLMPSPPHVALRGDVVNCT
ncbi:hypothetical protein QBC42DRAFT_11069 [Cladorrhinum samala]|uniref:Secreted protein n=1 Tax=Cladorrhinum samala TaxID=585594 RepID=A0AAV9HGA2_9PEZI|nr:hypothetical protein QBC42DRAFT_11069 [Cladorrhinum samala]